MFHLTYVTSSNLDIWPTARKLGLWLVEVTLFSHAPASILYPTVAWISTRAVTAALRVLPRTLRRRRTSILSRAFFNKLARSCIRTLRSCSTLVAVPGIGCGVVILLRWNFPMKSDTRQSASFLYAAAVDSGTCPCFS